MENPSDNTSKKKKTMGRRKIEMKKIEKKSSLQVAFSKRRAGLFKKASELSVLCGCEIAIFVQSPAEKMYSFGHPSADSTIRRFLTNDDNNCGGEKDCYYDSSSRLEYAEALKKIQLENNNNNNQEKDGGVWFDRSIEGMDMDDLEEYLEGLQGFLLSNVQNRLAEVNKNNNGNIVEAMGNDDDVNSAVMMDPGSDCASSSSSSLKGLVMVGDNHEREKSSSVSSSSIHNQYNIHGGSSSSSSLSMGQNNDSFERMRYDEIYAALKMELQAPPCSTSSSSSVIGGSPSSSTSVMAQHDPLPLPQDDESIEDRVNWCFENVDFDACEF